MCGWTAGTDHTLRDRGHAFYFTEYARQIGDVDHFMQIDDGLKYQDWLETAFFPNIQCAMRFSTPVTAGSELVLTKGVSACLQLQ